MMQDQCRRGTRPCVAETGPARISLSLVVLLVNYHNCLVVEQFSGKTEVDIYFVFYVFSAVVVSSDSPG